MEIEKGYYNFCSLSLACSLSFACYGLRFARLLLFSRSAPIMLAVHFVHSAPDSSTLG